MRGRPGSERSSTCATRWSVVAATSIRSSEPRPWQASPSFTHPEDPADEEFLAECGPWLDHPRSWAPNLHLFPDKILRVLTTVAKADTPVLIHCAGGRDRTGMIGSILLVLASATHQSIVANYEAGFRGAAEHRGHGWPFDPGTGEWVPAEDESWSTEELEAALADRRPALVEWLRSFDVEAYARGSGVETEALDSLRRLLADR